MCCGNGKKNELFFLLLIDFHVPISHISDSIFFMAIQLFSFTLWNELFHTLPHYALRIQIKWLIIILMRVSAHIPVQFSLLALFFRVFSSVRKLFGKVCFEIGAKLYGEWKTFSRNILNATFFSRAECRT